MNLSVVMLVLSAVFYGSAFLLHVLSFLEVWEKGRRRAFGLMRLGFLATTFYFLTLGVQDGFLLPVFGFPQAMVFFSWSIAFVYLVLLVKIQNESFGLVLNPLLFLLICFACLASRGQDSGVMDPEVLRRFARNPYFMLHIASAFFAYASFTISFAAGLLYLIQHGELKKKQGGNLYRKLPPLEILEKLTYRPLLWGAPLLALAMMSGFVWAESALGGFEVSEPKTLSTLVTLFLYLSMLYLRYGRSLRGKQFAVFSLIAYGVVLFGFAGTHLMHGAHYFVR